MSDTPKPKNDKQTVTVERLPNPPHRPDPQTVPQTVRGNFPARQDREHANSNGSSNGHKATSGK